MRILLVYPDLNIHINYPVGLGLISSCLQRAGHEVKVLHLNEELGFAMDLPRIRAIAEEFSPELIAFSSTTSQFKYVRELSEFFKKHFDLPILCGGIHPTIAPEEVLSTGVIDLVCIGEGEEAIVELADHMEKGTDYRAIRNLGYRDNGAPVLNPLRPLVEDIDSLPFPDRQGFDFGKIVSLKHGWANVMAGRGCIYQCTYCVNNYFHSLYADQTTPRKHMRIRTVDTILREVEEFVGEFSNIEMINFDDDIFTQDREWLGEFCARYKERVRLPFACNVQVNHFDVQRATMLYDAGCREVKIGLESGNEKLRKKLLKRYMSDETLITALKTAENAGLRAWTFNMVGFPTETKEMIMDTVRLNAKIRPYILRCSIFYPYKGTELYQFCEERNLLDNRKTESYSSYMEGSILQLEDLSETDIIKAKQMFKWMVDAESDIATADFFKLLVQYFDQLPAEMWHNNEAQELIRQMDVVVDSLFKLLKKEHYSSRKHLELNFTEKLGFDLP